MATITRELVLEIYDDVCVLLEKKLKISAAYIYQTDKLTSDLGFTKTGLRAFANDINFRFRLEISAAKVAVCKTVGDLCDLILDEMP